MSATDGANGDRSKHTTDETTLARQAHEAWEKKATFWDEMMGEGNVFQRVLVGPAAERLLKVRSTETDGGLGIASVNWVGGLISLSGLALALVTWLWVDRRYPDPSHGDAAHHEVAHAEMAHHH